MPLRLKVMIEEKKMDLKKMKDGKRFLFGETLV